MTTGSIIIEVDGKRSDITIPNVERVTAADLNCAMRIAGAPVGVRIMTAEDEAHRAQVQAKQAAQWRKNTLDALALEEPDDVQATLKRLGYSRGRLDGLSDKALARVAECFEPDSY